MVCDAEGILYAINAKSGKLEWKQELHHFSLPQFENGLGIKDGVVFAGQDSGLSAVRISDGKILWKNTSWAHKEASVATHIVENGRLHTTTSFNARYALDAATGKLLWKRNKSALNPYDYGYSTPVFYEGNMYFTELNSIVETDPETGKVLREIEVLHFFRTASNPRVNDGVLYVGTADDGVVAYDIRTFKHLWTYKTQPSLFYTSPYMNNSNTGVSSTISIVDNKVFFGASDGNLYCVGIASEQYNISKRNTALPVAGYLRNSNLGSTILADVLIDENMMYAIDYAGNMFKFDISKILEINHSPEFWHGYHRK